MHVPQDLMWRKILKFFFFLGELKAVVVAWSETAATPTRACGRSRSVESGVVWPSTSQHPRRARAKPTVASQRASSVQCRLANHRPRAPRFPRPFVARHFLITGFSFYFSSSRSRYDKIIEDMHGYRRQRQSTTTVAPATDSATVDVDGASRIVSYRHWPVLVFSFPTALGVDLGIRPLSMHSFMIQLPRL